MSVRTVRLGDVCELNPRAPKNIRDDAPVSFLPMSAVSEDGYIAFEEARVYGAVKKGYTYFERGDVLVAKITPCFENGKAAPTDSIQNKLGFGSTEFHVLRPAPEVDAKYVFYLLWNERFRTVGEKGMTGSAGQKRVPADLLRRLEIPLPPLEEQKRIAAILDKADALRRKRRQALALLDSLTQSIFLEMFGDPKTESNRWPTVSFAEACRDETSKSPKVLRGNYAEEGDIPVVDQGQKLIAGYTNQENVCVSRGPITLFGDHTRAVKFIDFDFAIGADGAKALKASECYEPIFFAALLSRLPIPDLGYSRHMREVKKLRFPVPDFDLQSLYAKKRSGLRVQERILANAVLMDDSLFASLQHRAFTGQL